METSSLSARHQGLLQSTPVILDMVFQETPTANASQQDSGQEKHQLADVSICSLRPQFSSSTYFSECMVNICLSFKKWYNTLHTRYIYTCYSAYLKFALFIHTLICKYVHTYIHTYIYTYIHTYVHTYIHIYIHAHIHAYIHTYNSYIPQMECCSIWRM